MSSTSQSTDSSENLNISIPKEIKQDSDVLFRIQKKGVPIEPKTEKFRSFCVMLHGHAISVHGKQIALGHLFNILKQHGLSQTLPIVVSLGEQNTKNVTFLNFDAHPAAYDGPTVWYFEWNGVKCSMAMQNQQFIYFRVHDLKPGVGETVLNGIADELLKFWVNPVPQRQLAIYTTSLTSQGYAWVQHSTRLHRDLDTIYINEKLKSTLVGELTEFLNSSELYDRYGITWKRIHLFHGPPGSGKTSTMLALASAFNKNIAKLTLTPDLNSQQVERLFQTVPQNTFLLLEDVDSLFTERKSNTSIDFSTLLNCMDGITTVRGSVLFMTTNHVTKLDAAFVRPGRIDLSVEFKLPGTEELRLALKVLGKGFESEHEEFLRNHCANMSIAGLQKHLFDCIMGKKTSILPPKKEENQ